MKGLVASSSNQPLSRSSQPSLFGCVLETTGLMEANQAKQGGTFEKQFSFKRIQMGTFWGLGRFLEERSTFKYSKASKKQPFESPCRMLP